MPTDADKEASAEAALSGQMARQRAAQQERELLENNHCVPAKHHRKIYGPSTISCQQRPSQDLHSPS